MSAKTKGKSPIITTVEYSMKYDQPVMEFLSNGGVINSFVKTIGINVPTAKLWMKEHPSFKAAVLKGMERDHLEKGRPSSYREEYCDQIVTFMSKGKSLLQFAALIGVSTDTIQEWGNTHQKFSVAKKKGMALCEGYWENVLQERTEKKMEGSESLLMFYMKNRFRWSEKAEVKTEQAVTFSTQIGDSGEVIREKS